MEPLERLIQDAVTGEIKADRACLLIVGQDDSSRHVIVDQVESTGHVCLVTDSLEEARDILEAHDAVDALMIDANHGGREAIRLIREAQNRVPWIRAMVWSDHLDPMQTLEAIREGASDYLVIPTDIDRINTRLDQLLDRVRSARNNENQMNNLMDTCRELTESRDEMSDQVDVLCNDLASAYRSMRDQMSDAVIVSEFKTLISQELDVEDMLRTSLEYMLRRVGPTNAVVYLPETPGRFGIGAYVNYDMNDGDPMPVYKALGEAMCSRMHTETELVRYEDGEAWSRSKSPDTESLTNMDLIAFSCRHNDETLAIISFFRDKENPFDDETAGLLDSLRSVLGEHLGRIVRIHRRGKAEWPREDTNDNHSNIDFDQSNNDSEWGDQAA